MFRNVFLCACVGSALVVPYVAGALSALSRTPDHAVVVTLAGWGIAAIALAGFTAAIRER